MAIKLRNRFEMRDITLKYVINNETFETLSEEYGYSTSKIQRIVREFIMTIIVDLYHYGTNYIIGKNSITKENLIELLKYGKSKKTLYKLDDQNIDFINGTIKILEESEADYINELISLCKDIKEDITDVATNNTETTFKQLFEDYKESLSKEKYVFAITILENGVYFINEEEYYHYFMKDDTPTRFLSVNESDMLLPTADNNEQNITHVSWDMDIVLVLRFLSLKKFLKK